MTISTKLALTTTIILWASAFAGIRAGLQGYDPLHLALLRFLLASLFLALLASLKGLRLPAPGDLPRIALVGFFGITAYNVALNYGEVTVSAGAASFIVNTVPIFTALFSMALLQEKIRLIGWLGMVISLTGVGLIALGNDHGLQFSPGALLILLAAICQSLYFVLQKPLLQKYTALEVVSYAIWLGAGSMLFFLPSLGETVSSAPLPATLAVIYLGLFPAALAYVSWSYVLSRIPASRASTFLYLVPVVSIVIAYLWLGESPAWLTLGGGVLALGGVALVTKPGRRKSAQATVSSVEVIADGRPQTAT